MPVNLSYGAIMNKFYIVMLSFFLLNACGSTSSDEKDKVDIANYLPATSMIKQYTNVSKVNGDLDNIEYSQNILVESNLVTIKKGNDFETLITISVDDITFKSIKDTTQSKILKRNIAVGETLSSYVKTSETKLLEIGTQRIGEQSTRTEENCILESILDSYQVFVYQYENYDSKHDILKIKCTSKTSIETKIDLEYIDLVSYTNGVLESKEDISYLYLQEGLGEIARINDDCLVAKLPDILDDTLDKEQCLGERYHYTLYHTQY